MNKRQKQQPSRPSAPVPTESTVQYGYQFHGHAQGSSAFHPPAQPLGSPENPISPKRNIPPKRVPGPAHARVPDGRRISGGSQDGVVEGKGGSGRQQRKQSLHGGIQPPQFSYSVPNSPQFTHLPPQSPQFSHSGERIPKSPHSYSVPQSPQFFHSGERILNSPQFPQTHSGERILQSPHSYPGERTLHSPGGERIQFQTQHSYPETQSPRSNRSSVASSRRSSISSLGSPGFLSGQQPRCGHHHPRCASKQQRTLDETIKVSNYLHILAYTVERLEMCDGWGELVKGL